MDLIIDNLYDFVKTGFWHYCLVLEFVLLWFVLSGGRKKPLLCAFVVGFLCTLTFHTMLRNSSSRYMLVPTLLALPIIGWGAVALKRSLDRKCRWGGKFRWGILIFCLLALGFATLSFLKFNRWRRHRRDPVVMSIVSLLRRDFPERNRREALLVGNSLDTGLVFAYAGLPGKFYYFAGDFEEPQRAVSQLELLCSQYPLVYVLKEQRFCEQSTKNRVFTWEIPARHSYGVARIDRGGIDPERGYGRVELYRVESQIAETADRARIAEFVAAPPAALRNGNFSRWQERRLTPDPHFGNRFLAEQPTRRLPVEWNVDFNNRRGSDFREWSFGGEPPDKGAEHGVWRLHAPRGGFALQSRTYLTMDRDCLLKAAAEFAPGSKLLVFLYVFRKDRSYLTAQPVGVHHCAEAGERLLSFPIRRDSLPADGAFFLVGLIGWNGTLALKKVDIVTP